MKDYIFLSVIVFFLSLLIYWFIFLDDIFVTVENRTLFVVFVIVLEFAGVLCLSFLNEARR